MTLEEQCRLSFYKEIAGLGSHENVRFVQHMETNRIYVKKVQNVYNKHIYQVLEKFENKHIPKIVECIEADGQLTIIEEYVQGESLAEHLEKNDVYSREQVLDIMITICEVLGQLHQMQPPIIHRDLKPENIIITDEGILKIVDFNTAKQFETGKTNDTVLIGTREYAAPEQYGFAQSDARTDIYALGVMMNYLLIHRFPKDCVYMSASVKPDPLTEIIRKCIEFSPDMRYQNVQVLLWDLQKAQNKSVKLENQVKNLEQNIATNTNSYVANANSEDINMTAANRINERWRANSFQSESKIQNGISMPQPSFKEKFIQLRDDLKVDDKEPKHHFWYNQYLLPGFRTGTIWKMLVAICGYAFILDCSFTMTVKPSTSVAAYNFELYGTRICVFIWLVLTVLISCDYLGIQKHLPLLKYRYIRVAMCVVYSLLIVMILVILLVIALGIQSLII